MDDCILRLTNLTKKFGSLTAVDGLNLEIKKGEVFGFLGPNGAGKTTTIRMMVGLIKPTSGYAEINGYNVQTDFLNAIKGIGAIVESPAFYPYLSGKNNLEILFDISGINLPANEKKRKIEKLLKLVGLEKRCNDNVGTYSQGMKQRLALAGTLVADPDIIILDEPTNGLDPSGMKEIRELIKNLAEEKNISVFLSSHILSEVQQICNRVGILDKGKLISTEEVATLLKKETENFLVRIKDSETAFTALKENTNIIEVKKAAHDHLLVTVASSFSDKLGPFLYEKGIYPEEIKKHEETLEDYFLRITGNNNVMD